MLLFPYVENIKTFPKNAICDPGIGEGYSTTSNSRHFMEISL
ncbi:MAG: hypothetical protein V3W07_11745 [Syntrophobacteria bacterium]